MHSYKLPNSIHVPVRIVCYQIVESISYDRDTKSKNESMLIVFSETF